MNSEYVDSQSTAIEQILPSLAVSPQQEEEATTEAPPAPAPKEDSSAMSALQAGGSRLDVWRDAIVVVCLFWILSSPFVYQQVNQFVTVLSTEGVPAPNATGLFLHGMLCGLLYYFSQKYLVF